MVAGYPLDIITLHSTSMSFIISSSKIYNGLYLVVFTEYFDPALCKYEVTMLSNFGYEVNNTIS